MKREFNTTPIKVLIMAAVMALAVFCLYKGVQKMGSGQQAESLKQLDNSIRKATLTCYATEGVYPPTIDYLKENYGIQIDEEQFTVFYEVFGDNIMPDITVMEKQ
jgi:sulfur relay (sulfurtransferase) DsrF/TusC family protein